MSSYMKINMAEKNSMTPQRQSDFWWLKTSTLPPAGWYTYSTRAKLRSKSSGCQECRHKSSSSPETQTKRNSSSCCIQVTWEKAITWLMGFTNMHSDDKREHLHPVIKPHHHSQTSQEVWLCDSSWEDFLSFPWDMNVASDRMFLSLLFIIKCVYGTAGHPQVHPKSQNLPSSDSWSSSPPITSGWNVKAAKWRRRYRRSLLDAGRVVWASRLDDLWTRWAGLVIVVAVVGARAVAMLILAHMDDYAGGGGRGSVELILFSWETHTHNDVTVQIL